MSEIIKVIGWKRQSFFGIPEKDKWDIEEAIEDNTYDKKEISLFKLIIACIFERGFFWKLTESLKYGLRHSDCYRGNGASDIILLRGTKSFRKIWK